VIDQTHISANANSRGSDAAAQGAKHLTENSRQVLSSFLYQYCTQFFSAAY
jgi:hypothetical protein